MPDQSKKRPHAGDNDDVPERDKTPENTVLPPEQQRSTKETPAKLRSVHSADFQDGNLEKKRMLLLCDLEHAIPEVELDVFLSTFFPPKKDGIDINSIMNSLTDDGTITNGRWSEFPNDPSKTGKKENPAFQPLQDIFNKVVERAVGSTSGLDQTFALRLLPNTSPKSERQSLSRPDGCFILKEVEDSKKSNKKVYRWYDLALTCEFKTGRGEAPRDDNVTKIAFSMQHTMTLDPCRRFTFGITIEDTQARLWFCSRAIMAVSEPFNFITDTNKLIHIFLSLAFATKAELGWDPTITVEDPNAEERVYVIKVDKKSYKVEKVLSDFGADAIIGRATRVFKVKCLEDGESYVLKDVWVEDDRALEHQIYKEILKDVAKQYNEATMKDVAKYLLTPVNHWLVTIDGRMDHTKEVMMRGNKVSFAKSFRLQSQDFGNEDFAKGVGPMKSTDREVRDELNAHLGTRIAPNEQKHALRHRRHYRVVYQEIARPVWTLTNLSDVFLVLRDSTIALKYIHGSGWVHRDISAGNIYFYEGSGPTGRGLIGDLEYAKKVTTDGSHDIRTGTPDFMAIEVSVNSYLFSQRDRDEEEIAKRARLDNEDEFGLAESEPLEPSVRNKLFVQNEAHDIESLWWISIYTLFFNRDESVEASQEETRMFWMKMIFPSSIGIGDRIAFFQDIGKFARGTEWFPSSFQTLRRRLNNVREGLVACYEKLERMLPNVADGTFNSLYNTAIASFEACMKKTANIKISSSKTKGRRHQKDFSQTHAPPPPLAESENVPELTDIPRFPEKRLNLIWCQAGKRD